MSTGEPRTGSEKFRGEFWVFSPTGKMLAMSSTRTSSVTLWDTSTGRERAVFGKFPERVLSLAISPGESQLAVSDKSGRVTPWNIPASRRQFTFHPAGQTVQGLAFSADGTQLAILAGAAKPGSIATVRPMLFSPDGKTLAATESLDDSTVRA